MRRLVRDDVWRQAGVDGRLPAENVGIEEEELQAARVPVIEGVLHAPRTRDHQQLFAVERPSETPAQHVLILEHRHRAQHGREHAHLAKIIGARVELVLDAITALLSLLVRRLEDRTWDDDAGFRVDIDDGDAAADRAVEHRLVRPVFKALDQLLFVLRGHRGAGIRNHVLQSDDGGCGIFRGAIVRSPHTSETAKKTGCDPPGLPWNVALN